MKVEGIDISCARCPHIRGADYCIEHKKRIWKEDRMCRSGFWSRITFGMNKAVQYYNKDKFDKRVDDILKNLARFQDLYLRMEGNGEFEKKEHTD